METTSDYNLWQLFAGIGLFLFGMQLLEFSIRHLAGRSFKLFLKNQTSNPLKGVLVGLLITAVLQSSSIVNLLVLAFVGARILDLSKAMAIILGANLGSTVYNWIVVFLGFKIDIETFAFPIIALATAGLIFYQDRKKVLYWTRLAFGLALLFLGLANIKTGIESVVMSTDLTTLKEFGNVVFVLAGFVITVLVQSSSTTVVIALSALNAGAISFEAAACLVIGSETGTSIKTVIGSIGTDNDKKRVAVGNLVINFTASAIAFIFLGWSILLIQETLAIKDPLIGLVFFQSLINLAGIILFFPILKPFSSWLERLYKTTDDKLSFHLNSLLLSVPEEALSAIDKEVRRLIQNIILLNKQALEIEHSPEQLPEQIRIAQATGKTFSSHYEIVKHLNGEIIDFCIDLKNRNPDHTDDKKIDNFITVLRLTMNSAKSIKDIRHNIKEYRDSADDLLHEIYNNIRKREEVFYPKISALIAKENSIVSEDIEELLYESKKEHENSVHEIFQQATKNKLHDLEIATLINVFESIRQSHESLLNAIKELADQETTIKTR